MTILIVEDFDDTRHLLSLMVQMRGCKAVEAANGAEAIEVASRELPDLILMDLNMPVLDGWEATRRIVSQPRTSHIPIVAISAQGSGSWRELALNAGACDCLSKPVDLATFDTILNRFSCNP